MLSSQPYYTLKQALIVVKQLHLFLHCFIHELHRVATDASPNVDLMSSHLSSTYLFLKKYYELWSYLDLSFKLKLYNGSFTTGNSQFAVCQQKQDTANFFFAVCLAKKHTAKVQHMAKVRICRVLQKEAHGKHLAHGKESLFAVCLLYCIRQNRGTRQNC